MTGELAATALCAIKCSQAGFKRSKPSPSKAPLQTRAWILSIACLTSMRPANRIFCSRYSCTRSASASLACGESERERGEQKQRPGSEGGVEGVGSAPGSCPLTPGRSRRQRPLPAPLYLLLVQRWLRQLELLQAGLDSLDRVAHGDGQRAARHLQLERSGFGGGRLDIGRRRRSTGRLPAWHAPNQQHSFTDCLNQPSPGS